MNPDIMPSIVCGVHFANAIVAGTNKYAVTKGQNKIAFNENKSFERSVEYVVSSGL